MIVPTLSTPRLNLRGWNSADLNPWAAMMADPRVAAGVSEHGQPIGRSEAWLHMAGFIGHWALRGYGPFAIARQGDGQFVGRVGPWRAEGMIAAELMIAFAHAHWGNGYFDEVLDAVWDWLATATDVESVDYAVRTDNPRSIAAVRRWLTRHDLPSITVEQARGRAAFEVYSIPVRRMVAAV